MPAVVAIGLAGTHLHDLRHTESQFTADAGANPRELMARVGHDSARAALIYLYSSAERQRALANEVGKNARAALSQPNDKSKRSGTRKARIRRGLMNRSRQPVTYMLSWDFTGAPGRIRTRDPLLRRYRRSVARRRLASLYEPFASSYCR